MTDRDAAPIRAPQQNALVLPWALALALIVQVVAAVWWLSDVNAQIGQLRNDVQDVEEAMPELRAYVLTEDDKLHRVVNDYVARTLRLQERAAVVEDDLHEMQANRFTGKDADLMLAAIKQELAAERAFARQVCNDLTRLYRELDRIAPNDCGRP